MAPVRRSTRLSGPKKYTDDVFDENAEIGDPDLSLPRGQRSKRTGKEEDPEVVESSDDEFDDPGSNDDDRDDGLNEASEGDDEERLSTRNEVKIEPGLPRKEARIARRPGHKKKRPEHIATLSEDETHTRGIWNPIDTVAKQAHLRLTFGTDERDLLAIIRARDIWYKGVDSGFPTRAALNEAQTFPAYGFGLTFGVDPDLLERESSRGWDWYYKDAKSETRQTLEPILGQDARQTYMPRPAAEKHTVIVGPSDQQRVFKIGHHESFNFGEAFEERHVPASRIAKAAAGNRGKRGLKDHVEDGGLEIRSPARHVREGWVLNVGCKVQCLAWAPNQSGPTQYLAVSGPVREEHTKSDTPTSKREGASAFTPSATSPASLQIWTFEGERDECLTKTLDMSSSPRLRLVLCSEWGELRKLSWCPMARVARDEDEEDGTRMIGLLATIWGDGAVRIKSPLFAAKPPSTVCTCVTWLSPSDIAVGCANGSVGVWSIARNNPPSDPEPYVYRHVHSTYILNLASAHPTHPHLLASTSMDGETRLFSMLDTDIDVTETNRMRIGSPHLAYSPVLQTFFSGDETDFARMLAVRRFYTTSTLARLPSTMTALAPCSSWHPSILMGSAGGTVIAANALRKLLHPKTQQMQQTWFTHEWVKGPEASGSGTSRFQDGFRAESVSLSRNMIGDPRMVNGTLIVTIFDEGTHITSLAWNPNQSCAGWASAGMGCGLIRVEDLAIE